MFGYAGKMLDIDLSKRSVKIKETPDKLARAFLGGRGLGAALLSQSLPAGVHPLSPENIIVFSTGPATATLLPACARWELVTKSPLTGTYLCSCGSSHLGSEIKFAGFDALVIRGKAEEPSWLHISDGGVEIREAGSIWGKDVEETEAEIRKALGDRLVCMASIGQAGENLVKFASIQVDMTYGARGGSFGRGGTGAVMGSKNLKVISARGHGKIEVADDEGFHSLLKELREQMKTNVQVRNFSRWGTTQFVAPVNEAGMWPTRNFREGAFEGAPKLEAEKMRNDIVKQDTACHACTIACGKYSMVSDGPYNGTVVDGPEYETIWSFGPQCGVDRLDAIAAANLSCDRYGMDTISAGNAIGFAMECCERGLLSKNDVDGLDMRFGNHEVLLPLLRKIALRDGFGDALAEGVRAAAKKIGKGSEGFAMHVKGMELPAYDPRGAWGMGLSYATSCRGGCHLKAWTMAAEVFAPKYDRFSTEGKAKLVFDMQNTRALIDSTGVCVFGSRAIGIEEMRKILQHVVGWSISTEEMKMVGERIYNLERQLAVRDGISRKDDTLPRRIFEQSLPGLGKRLPKEALEKMLDEYYQTRGWDEDGRPKPEKLKELGLDGFAEARM
ncbi:MAG: aldehyde ferredoxin oxidoreductase family protein [Candidatus Hadarchaeota archaeon]